MNTFDNISDEEFEKILKMIGGIADELNKLPTLKFPELSGEMNDLLWKYDGISEAQERMETENDLASIDYYTNAINERYKEIRENYLHLLN